MKSKFPGWCWSVLLLGWLAAGPTYALEAGAGDALVAAARAGDVGALETALSAGADINFKNSYTETALMNAADAGQMDTLRALIAHGADLDALNRDHSTALLFAAIMGKEQAGLELVKHGAQCDIAGVKGMTPLLAAAQEHLGSLALALLEKSANPNTADRSGRTALHYAAQAGDEKLVRALAEKGAQLDVQDRDERTPLMEAVLFRRTFLVPVFISLKADVNATDLYGNTAYALAEQTGQIDSGRSLLEAGARKQEVGINRSPYRFTPLPAPQRWALALPAVLNQLNRESHELLGATPRGERQEARLALAQWWGIHNRADALKILDWLANTGQRSEFAAQLPGKKLSNLLAWDACRLVWVAGKSCVAGYLKEDEAWARIMPVAQAVQANYKSWTEVSEAYLQGREIWKGQSDPGAEAVAKLLLNPKDPLSPWNINPWSTKLDQ